MDNFPGGEILRRTAEGRVITCLLSVVSYVHREKRVRMLEVDDPWPLSVVQNTVPSTVLTENSWNSSHPYQTGIFAAAIT